MFFYNVAVELKEKEIEHKNVIQETEVLCTYFTCYVSQP